MLNKPNPRLAILRSQLAASAKAIEEQRFQYQKSARNPTFKHHHHHDYDDDLAVFFAECAARASPPEKVAAPDTEYLICICSHVAEPFFIFEVGAIFEKTSHLVRVQNNFWLPCDRDGWIIYTPPETVNAESPVPSTVSNSQVKLKNGDITANPYCWGSGPLPEYRVKAWRPMA